MQHAASAPAKVILLGEHAVVYGFPAMAVPVSNLRATASVARSSERLSVTVSDLGQRIVYGDSSTHHSLEPLASIMSETVDFLELEAPTGKVFVVSEIPIASGLGSSAAVSAATARGIATLFEKEIPDHVLNRLVYESEKLFHGTPSGIDNTVVVYEKPVYFERDCKIETLEAKGKFHFLIGDSGISSSTKTAVSHVRGLYQKEPASVIRIFQHIRQIVADARTCIVTGNQGTLGNLMFENHVQLRRLQVSAKELDRLVDAATDAGALGAKLSGGGMGGNMIALVQPADIDLVKLALRQAGAVQVRDFTLSKDAKTR